MQQELIVGFDQNIQFPKSIINESQNDCILYRGIRKWIVNGNAVKGGIRGRSEMRKGNCNLGDDLIHNANKVISVPGPMYLTEYWK